MFDQFSQTLQALGDKALRLKDNIQTEEATKTSLVMPFISALGYDVFDPGEVVPEYIADIGIKKGEKIDFAVMRDGKPIMIFECKHWREKLDPHHSQLFRYFHTLHVRFAILTNGTTYRFYTDMITSNKMDEMHFLEVNLTELRETYIRELHKFHKSSFDEVQILTTASELRYTTQIRHFLAGNVFQPSADFIRFVLKTEYDGAVTQKIFENLEPIVKKAFEQSLSDQVSKRLKAALINEHVSIVPDLSPQIEEADTQLSGNGDGGQSNNGIVTTVKELEGFYAIKNMLRNNIVPSRIHYRDNKTFFSVVIDGTNRKTVCKLFFDDDASSYITITDENKTTTKYPIQTIDDLFQIDAQLIQSADRYK